MYCRNCGSEIDEMANFCLKCGVRNIITQKEDEKEPLEKVEDVDKKVLDEVIKISIFPSKNPGLAAVISTIIPGFGQIYNGQITKGIASIIIVTVTVYLIPYVNKEYGEYGKIILLVSYALFWANNIYDAYKSAEDITYKVKRQ